MVGGEGPRRTWWKFEAFELTLVGISSIVPCRIRDERARARRAQFSSYMEGILPSPFSLMTRVSLLLVRLRNLVNKLSHLYLEL